MRKFLFGTKKRKTLAVLSVLALISASAAFAAWLAFSNTVAGKGKFTTVTLTATVLSGSAASDSGCYPGGKCDLQLQVTGPAGFIVNAAAMNVPITYSTSVAACTTWANGGGLSIDAAFQPYSTYAPIPPVTMTGSPVTVTVPDAINVASDSPTSCQGADITTAGAGGISVSGQIGS